MTRIAVDAMGGDFAPEATVRGAMECLRQGGSDIEIVLVGDERRITPHLDSALSSGWKIVHTSEVIEMGESATTAIKSKKDSSILKTLEMHKAGLVDGVISAGNTGAVMAASTLTLGRIDGVSRPTIGTTLPTGAGQILLVDAGANVDCKAQHLAQFAVMGAIFVEHLHGKQKPTVGLLNVGEEEGKGNDVVKEAYSQLKEAPVNFIGNIEGGDVLRGKADVVVCDGFIGNVLLKFAESIPSVLKTKFRDYARRGLRQKLLMAMVAGSIREMFRDWDYQELGGVPLLGLNGISLIGHGSSTPKAIRNMIFQAKRMVDARINDRIAEAIRSYKQQGTNET